jgi:hypothetical protein
LLFGAQCSGGISQAISADKSTALHVIANVLIAIRLKAEPDLMYVVWGMGGVSTPDDKICKTSQTSKETFKMICVYYSHLLQLVLFRTAQ